MCVCVCGFRVCVCLCVCVVFVWEGRWRILRQFIGLGVSGVWGVFLNFCFDKRLQVKRLHCYYHEPVGKFMAQASLMEWGCNSGMSPQSVQRTLTDSWKTGGIQIVFYNESKILLDKHFFPDSWTPPRPVWQRLYFLFLSTFSQNLPTNIKKYIN